MCKNVEVRENTGFTTFMIWIWLEFYFIFGIALEENKKKEQVGWSLFVCLFGLEFGVYGWLLQVLETPLAIQQEDERHQGTGLSYCRWAMSGPPIFFYL